MNRSLRALAALLSYPDEELVTALPEIGASSPRQALPLLEELSREDLYTLQERYVALFDRSRALSLHLFEHVHGESRDRGQAMVDLQQMYAQRGLQVGGGELPDFLPAFLEYLSLLDKAEARRLLGKVAHILRAIGEGLARRGSRYAGVFSALLRLAGERAIAIPVAARADDEESREAMDRTWMEAPVTFGGPQPIKFYRNRVAT
jgi:nitrate reductase delta subunit